MHPQPTVCSLWLLKWQGHLGPVWCTYSSDALRFSLPPLGLSSGSTSSEYLWKAGLLIMALDAGLEDGGENWLTGLASCLWQSFSLHLAESPLGGTGCGGLQQ